MESAIHILYSSIWDHEPARANDYAGIVPKILVIPLRNRAMGYPTLRRWSHNFFEPAWKSGSRLRANRRLQLYIGFYSGAAWVFQIWFGPKYRLRVHFSPCLPGERVGRGFDFRWSMFAKFAISESHIAARGYDESHGESSTTRT